MLQNLAKNADRIIPVSVLLTDVKTLTTVHAMVAMSLDTGVTTLIRIKAILEHPFRVTERQLQPQFAKF